MSRRFTSLPVLGLLLAPLLTLLLALGLSACGGSDPDPKADPTPSTTPTPSPSTTPSPTGQPSGANGVTVRITNWDQYADQPVVLAWKQSTEAGEASINQRHLLPAFVQGTTGTARRKLVQGTHFGWDRHWHVPALAYARVRSLHTGATRATLDVCSWQPSFAFHDKHGQQMGPPNKYWQSTRYTMRSSGGAWVMAAYQIKDRCPGGAPR